MATKKTRMDELAGRLEEELASARRDLADLQREMATLARDDGQEGGVPTNHMADEGSNVYERERLMTVEIELARRIEEIEDAQRRLAKGTYGVCERCGRKIAPERLEALPFARFCIDCQEVVDQETGGQGRRSRPQLTPLDS